MKKILIGFYILVLLITLSFASLNVINRTQKGVFVGNLFQPDNIRFNPKTLKKLSFFSPTGERPVYEIAVPFGDLKGAYNAYVDTIKINGREFTSGAYYIFVNGEAQVYTHRRKKSLVKEGKDLRNIVILIRSLWHNREKVKVEVSVKYRTKNGRKAEEKRVFTGLTPTKGGMPDWTVDYESFSLSEEAGLDRVNEPFTFSLSVIPSELLAPHDESELKKEVRIFRIGENGELKEIPFQIFDLKSVNPPKYVRGYGSWYLHTPAINAKIFFFANVKAHQKVPYIITYGSIPKSEKPEISTPLKIKKLERQGFIISNRFYTVYLDKRSGQIKKILLKGKEKNIMFKESIGRALQYNPGVLAEDEVWSQTYRWNPPDFTKIITKGKMLFKITRYGRLNEQVYAYVTYDFYSNTPFIGISTVTEVKHDCALSQLRTSEILLDSNLVTHYVWKSRNGNINIIPTLQRAGLLDSAASFIDAELPWIAMVNKPKGYGISTIWYKIAAFNKYSGIRPVYRPQFILYSHIESSVPLTYFTRTWIIPFAYKGTRPDVLTKRGSTFFDRGVIFPFYFTPNKNDFYKVENLNKKLRTPLLLKAGN